MDANERGWSGEFAGGGDGDGMVHPRSVVYGCTLLEERDLAGAFFAAAAVDLVSVYRSHIVSENKRVCMRRRRNQLTQPLWADVPVENPRDDQLGRAEFASTIARTIRSMKGTESFVFALCGPWGSGKSSVLRMIVRELGIRRGQRKPIVVNFNPWWFSGHEQLLSSFFAQLGSVLGREDSSEGISKLGERLGTFGKALRPLAWIPGLGALKEISEAMSSGSEAVKSLADQLTADVQKVRSEIDAELRRSKRRIVVVMDDIDRLVASEIAQLFAIVKAVADFPNTVYLLSFDHAVVSQAIQAKLELDGASYLEKIVQVHIDIPPPSGVMLQQMFLQQLNGLLPNDSVNDKSKKDFANLFHDGLKDFLKTPRSVKRLTNVLRVLFPGISGEVYWPDFIAMTALQVFIPRAYRAVRDNGHHFVSAFRGGAWGQDEREQTKKFHEMWLAELSLSDREIVTDLLKRLFPKFGNVLGGSGYGSDWETTWKAELRVCASDCFDRYFQFRVPEGSMSEAEWRDFLGLLSTPELALSRIVGYCTETVPTKANSRAKEFLDQVLVFAKHKASVEQAKALFIILLRCGDVLVSTRDEDRQYLLPIDNELRLQWALLQLLERIPEGPEREQFLETSIAESALVPITKLLWLFGAEHGRFGETKNKPHEPLHVSEACIDRLIPLVVSEIEKAAAGGSLARHPKSLAIARDWSIFDSSGAAHKWVRQTAASDDSLLKFLFSAQSKTASHSIHDRVATEGLSAGADFLLMWFDGIELRKRCQAILAGNHGWLTPEGKAALQLVLRSIDEDGKALDPIHFTRRTPAEDDDDGV